MFNNKYKIYTKLLILNVKIINFGHKTIIFDRIKAGINLILFLKC